MNRNNLWALIILSSLAAAACSDSRPPATAPGGPPAQGGSVSDAEGTDLAKEILSTFDQAVDDTLPLVKDRPTADAFKPLFDPLLKRYADKMAALNTRYLDLKKRDIRVFGVLNGYMGENRGKHVNRMYTVLGKEIAYYNRERVDPEMARLLEQELPKLIDVAVKM